jgi:hypothetical protein
VYRADTWIAAQNDYQNPMRESQTERTLPTIISHILVRQVLGGYPRQYLTTMEVGDSSRPPSLRCSVASEDSGQQFALLLTTASLERMKTSE